LNFRDLGNSNISGTLGPELGEVRHLKYLYVICLPLLLHLIIYYAVKTSAKNRRSLDPEVHPVSALIFLFFFKGKKHWYFLLSET